MTWRGKFNNNGSYPGQCVNIIKQYFRDVLSLPVVSGNAIDYWNNPPQGFLKIPKTLVNHPQPGDIIIWDTSYNPVGHIAICNWWRLLDLGVFEQNNPLGSPCQFGEHTYKNILGWLRPLNTSGTVRIARVGSNLPSANEFKAQVSKFTKNKLTLVINDYTDVLYFPGMMQQSDATNYLKSHYLKENFVQLYYQSPNAPFLVSYGVPGTTKYASTLPNNPDAFHIAFELAHCLQYFCNDRLNAQIQIEDSNFPDEAFTQRKYDTVIKYIDKIS